jgi:hypothetical protein
MLMQYISVGFSPEQGKAWFDNFSVLIDGININELDKGNNSSVVINDTEFLRVPVLSFTLFQKLTKNIEISDEELKLFCSSPVIKESIFIASTSLYKELEK